MNTKWVLAFGFAAMLSPVLAATPAYVRDAIADPARPKDESALDAERKPAEMIAFAGLRPGSRVMDFMAGSGYFTHIFAKVVGAKGWVYAYTPKEIDPIIEKRFPGADPTKQFMAYSNVSVIHAPTNSLAAPELLDVVWTAQNYHDVHDTFMAPADTAILNKAIFAALKPGGLYVILDHAAKDGSGLSATETLHRIDEAQVKKEVEAAGFKLIAESKVMRNPADPRDKLVFDPSIRHHTDQFLLKFMKPRH